MFPWSCFVYFANLKRKDLNLGTVYTLSSLFFCLRCQTRLTHMDCLVCPDMAPRCHRGNGCRIAANVSSKDNQALKEIVCQCVTESEYEHTQTHTNTNKHTLSDQRLDVWKWIRAKGASPQWQVKLDFVSHTHTHRHAHLWNNMCTHRDTADSHLWRADEKPQF